MATSETTRVRSTWWCEQMMHNTCHLHAIAKNVPCACSCHEAEEPPKKANTTPRKRPVRRKR